MTDYLYAFLIGGGICALVQILLEKTKLMPGRIMVLLGFGHVLMKGVKEAVDEKGFIGLFTGGFKAGAVGSSAALIFGYLASLIFRPRMRK